MTARRRRKVKILKVKFNDNNTKTSKSDRIGFTTNKEAHIEKRKNKLTGEETRRSGTV